MSLTGIPEVDFQTLLNLDLISLQQVCQTNRYIQNICQDDYFWYLKVQHDFGDLVDYKPVNITYRQQYQTLSNPNLIDAIHNNRPDVLEVLKSQGKMPNIKAANAAAALGNFETLAWLAANNIYPNLDGAIEAAVQDNIQVLTWMNQRELYNKQILANFAAVEELMPTLEWLAAKNIYPDMEAAEMSSLEVLQFMDQHQVLDKQYIANMADAYERYDVLTWLASQGVYPEPI